MVVLPTTDHFEDLVWFDLCLTTEFFYQFIYKVYNFIMQAANFSSD